jgi:hypothetical protein
MSIETSSELKDQTNRVDCPLFGNTSRDLPSNLAMMLMQTMALSSLHRVCSCYLRLSDNPRAKEALRSYLPQSLITAQMPFRNLAESDAQLMQLLRQLRAAVGINDPTHGPAEHRRQSLGTQSPTFSAIGNIGNTHGVVPPSSTGVGTMGYYLYK